MTTVDEQTPGNAAVLAWSKKIHHPSGDRHAWALHCAALMDAHGPDAHLPAFPSPFRSTRLGRDETVRRIYRQARGGGS